MWSALLLLVLGASGADASIGSIEPLISRVPVTSQVSEIPDGQREVTVSWTLSAETSGTRVVLYAGTSLGLGTPLAEVSVVPGVSSYQFVDRSSHHGQWLYWLVVVDGLHRGVVLGTLVCVSPGMNEKAAPAGGLTPDPALAEWLEAEPLFHGRTLPEEPMAARDQFLKSPPSPPPEGA